MGRVIKLAIILACLFLVLTTREQVYSQSLPFSNPSEAQTSVNCEEILDAFLAEEDPIENLHNPVLTTRETVGERIEFYEDVLVCLEVFSGGGVDPGELEYLIERFIVLVDDTDHKIDYVDLETSTDPGIVKLREEVKLPPPKGLVYVNHFKHRLKLPYELVELSERLMLARGVTLQCRFVIVFDEPIIDLGDYILPFIDKEDEETAKKLHKETMPKVVSHELAHAYLNNILCGEDELPEWFHEGMATYFTGSGEAQWVVDAEGVMVSSPPDEYKEYDLVFRYLGAQLGGDGFNQVVREAFGDNSVEGIFQKTETTSYEDLLEKAQVWEKEQEKEEAIIKVVIIVGIGIAFLVLFLFLLPRFLR